MSNMNGGVMKSQRARVGAGYQPPALPFAQFPNPDSVLGRVYTASDVGPAPGIELIAAPGRWRPSGGRQVLAMRVLNPVTYQATSQGVIETIGPFPGGLVRAGMRLNAQAAFSVPAIGASNRTVYVATGNGLSPNIGLTRWLAVPFGSSAGDVRVETIASLLVQSDTSANHRSGGSTQGLAAAGGGYNPPCDFSAPWYFFMAGVSQPETAVNISSATWAADIATFNTSAAHTLAVGDKTVTAGVTPSGYNIPAGAIVLTAPTTTQFTVALAADPGAYTSGGTSSRISNVISQSYVLELVG